MNICKCGKCGHMIHRAPRCWHCGSDAALTLVVQPQIHSNVESQYSKAQQLLEQERFGEVLRLSETLIQWMPREADVYWLRFLAKNRACSDAALIAAGALCEADPDYQNAMQFASDNQRRVYTDVKEKIDALADQLGRCCAEQSRKAIVELVANAGSIRDDCWQKCKSMYARLSETARLEFELYATAQQWRAAAQETGAVLTDAYERIEDLRKTLSQVSECTEAERQQYERQLAVQQRRSEEAAMARDIMKREDPLVYHHQQLMADRDRKVEEFNAALEAFRQEKQKLREALDQIEAAERNERNRQSALQRRKFRRIRNEMGEEAFDRILRDAQFFE